MSSSSSRRAFLQYGGASATGLILTSCGPQASDEAHAPWTRWNDPAQAGRPLSLVAAAILAANPHDTQPWLFRVNEQSIAVFADTSRHLGAMDPMLREMHIGLGCAIETLCLAAPANGFEAKVELKEGSLLDLHDRRGPVQAATIHLTRPNRAQPSPAYLAIAHRHTNRNPYERTRPMPPAWRSNLAGLANDPRIRLFLFEGGPERAAYDAAVVDSTQAIISDAAMIGDSDRWFRGSHAQIERYRSGPTFQTAGLSPLTQFMAETVPLPAAYKHQAWLAQTRDDQVATAPLTGLIAVRDRYDRPSALTAGRLWQRLHLSATLAGVAVQPLNQPVEMVDRDRQLGHDGGWDQRLGRLAGDEGWQPTFSFRAGMCARTAGASPRRALADALLQT